MYKVTRLRVPELHPNLTCTLCGGYLVDATTIVECLHSFCRSCIVRYFDLHNTCPKCNTQVHKTRPLLNIRPDKTLQDLVYKLIPGLFKEEMRRRRAYYKDNPEARPNTSCPDASELGGEITEDRFVVVEEEKISLTLQHYNRDADSEGVLNLEESILNHQKADQRFLLCPEGVTVEHLKKFVRFKFGLEDDLKIAVFHSDEILKEDYTLIDIANLYGWRRLEPLKLYYLVHDRPHVTLVPPSRPSSSLSLERPRKTHRKRLLPHKKVKRLRKRKLLKTGLSVAAPGICIKVPGRDMESGLPPVNGVAGSVSPCSVTSVSGHSVELPRSVGQDNWRKDFSLDSVCDSGDQSGGEKRPLTLTEDSPDAQGHGDCDQSPTNNNEPAVTSPCKNAPTTGCLHARSLKLTIVTAKKDLAHELQSVGSKTISKSHEGAECTKKPSAKRKSGDKAGFRSAESAERLSSGTEETVKIGYNYRKVDAPNFSGLLKIPIVSRKILSPTTLGGVVRREPKYVVSSSESSHEVSPPHRATTSLATVGHVQVRRDPQKTGDMGSWINENKQTTSPCDQNSLLPKGKQGVVKERIPKTPCSQPMDLSRSVPLTNDGVAPSGEFSVSNGSDIAENHSTVVNGVPSVDKPRPSGDKPRPSGDIPRHFVQIPRQFGYYPRPNVDKTRTSVNIPLTSVGTSRPTMDKPRPYMDKPRPSVDRQCIPVDKGDNTGLTKFTMPSRQHGCITKDAKSTTKDITSVTKASMAVAMESTAVTKGSVLVTNGSTESTVVTNDCTIITDRSRQVTAVTNQSSAVTKEIFIETGVQNFVKNLGQVNSRSEVKSMLGSTSLPPALVSPQRSSDLTPTPVSPQRFCPLSPLVKQNSSSQGDSCSLKTNSPDAHITLSPGDPITLSPGDHTALCPGTNIALSPRTHLALSPGAHIGSPQTIIHSPQTAIGSPQTPIPSPQTPIPSPQTPIPSPQTPFPSPTGLQSPPSETESPVFRDTPPVTNLYSPGNKQNSPPRPRKSVLAHGASPGGSYHGSLSYPGDGSRRAAPSQGDRHHWGSSPPRGRPRGRPASIGRSAVPFSGRFTEVTPYPYYDGRFPQSDHQTYIEYAPGVNRSPNRGRPAQSGRSHYTGRPPQRGRSPYTGTPSQSGRPQTSPRKSPGQDRALSRAERRSQGVLAHGCVSPKRPSPQAANGGSPPKRVRLNVCHGVQNIQSGVTTATSSLTQSYYDQSGPPVFMTSSTGPPPHLTFGRHIHPAFFINSPGRYSNHGRNLNQSPANGYDAPLELTTKKRHL